MRGLGLRACLSACPKCVCARPGVRARDWRMCITCIRGDPGLRPQPPNPIDTHRTATAGAGQGGPRPQSFPTGRPGGVPVPQAAAFVYSSHRLRLRSQLAGGGLSLKGWGAGPLSIGRGGASPRENRLPSRLERSFGQAAWSSPHHLPTWRTGERYCPAPSVVRSPGGPGGSATCLPPLTLSGFLFFV